MTRALVTGGTGFAGQYLVRYLADEGVEVHATSHAAHSESPGAAGIHALDVRDAAAVTHLLRELAPDEIYHLAGITRPASGDVSGFYDVNLGGARNILEALRTESLASKLLLVGSAYAYAPSGRPMDEDWSIAPHNHYGASKAAAEMLGRAYAADGLHVVMARPFNHSGPGQPADFVLPTIVKQVVDARTAGHSHVTLELGNLDSVRDISDVRDVVAGYRIALLHGDSGSAYNLGSGVGHSIGELVDMVVAKAGIKAQVSRHPTLVRATDIPYLVADNARLRSLGWENERHLETTVADMVNDTAPLSHQGI